VATTSLPENIIKKNSPHLKQKKIHQYCATTYKEWISTLFQLTFLSGMHTITVHIMLGKWHLWLGYVDGIKKLFLPGMT
jgi:hypothetical protein